jgi:hypothetical protein
MDAETFGEEHAHQSLHVHVRRRARPQMATDEGAGNDAAPLRAEVGVEARTRLEVRREEARDPTKSADVLERAHEDGAVERVRRLVVEEVHERDGAREAPLADQRRHEGVLRA